MTALAPPPGWTIPEGYTFSSMGLCRGCGARMAWTTTPADRASPLDQDGQSHFISCPDRDRFRKRKPA
jgi:hypothetical protein